MILISGALAVSACGDREKNLHCQSYIAWNGKALDLNRGDPEKDARASIKSGHPSMYIVESEYQGYSIPVSDEYKSKLTEIESNGYKFNNIEINVTTPYGDENINCGGGDYSAVRNYVTRFNSLIIRMMMEGNKI